MSLRSRRSSAEVAPGPLPHHAGRSRSCGAGVGAVNTGAIRRTPHVTSFLPARLFDPLAHRASCNAGSVFFLFFSRTHLQRRQLRCPPALWNGSPCAARSAAMDGAMNFLQCDRPTPFPNHHRVIRQPASHSECEYRRDVIRFGRPRSCEGVMSRNRSRARRPSATNTRSILSRGYGVATCRWRPGLWFTNVLGADVGSFGLVDLAQDCVPVADKQERLLQPS